MRVLEYQGCIINVKYDDEKNTRHYLTFNETQMRRCDFLIENINGQTVPMGKLQQCFLSRVHKYERVSGTSSVQA